MSARVWETVPPVTESWNSFPTSEISLEKKDATGIVVVSERTTQWVSHRGAAVGMSHPASSARPVINREIRQPGTGAA